MADVVAVAGSSRKGGNTEKLAAAMLEELATRGFSTLLISLAGKQIRNCTACEKCAAERRCRLKDDFQAIYEELVAAKGIILATPVYYFGPTPQMAAFCIRTGQVAKPRPLPKSGGEDFDFTGGYPEPSTLARKVGTSLAVARRAGAIGTVDHLDRFLLLNQMFVVGTSYPSVVYGMNKGDALGDVEGIANLKMLADNFAWLMEKVYA